MPRRGLLAGMVDTALADPGDRLTAQAVGDIYEECGELKLALAWRWMAREGRRPGRREGERVQRVWGWYRDVPSEHWALSEMQRWQALAHARLPWGLWRAMSQRGPIAFILYDTVEEAIAHLAEELWVMDSVLNGVHGVEGA
jgi:hypothetical protein